MSKISHPLETIRGIPTIEQLIYKNDLVKTLVQYLSGEHIDGAFQETCVRKPM